LPGPKRKTGPLCSSHLHRGPVLSYVAAMANGCKRHFRCFEEVSRTQPNRARRTEVAAQRRQACVPEAQASAVFLAADAGTSDEEITKSVGVSGSTVYRTKRRFVEGNRERALSEEPRPGGGTQTHGQGRSLTGGDRLRQSAKGPCPLDLKLLAGAMVKLTEHKSLSHETVRGRLAENGLKPWRKTCVHSAGRRRIRRPHGGCARPLCRGVRQQKESGVLPKARCNSSARCVSGATAPLLASESAVLNKFAAERLTTSVVVTVFTCTCCHRAGNPTNDGDWDLAARGRTIYRFDK
jgi:hypothetical protein